MRDMHVAAEAVQGAKLHALARRQALLFLVALFAASWLCVIDDGGQRAHQRAAAASSAQAAGR